MSAGLAAPDGFLWCRGASGAWHFLRAGEVTHEGTARSTVQSLCGLWASLRAGERGWEEVTHRTTPEPRRICTACLAAVADAQRRDRLVTSPVAQPRLL